MRTTATEDDGASGLLEAVHEIRAGRPPSWAAWVAARPRLRGNPVLAQEAARQDRRGCLRAMWPDLDASARTGALLSALDAHQAAAARWMLAHWMGPWPLEAFVAAARAGSWPLARRIARARPDAMNATLFAEAVSAAPPRRPGTPAAPPSPIRRPLDRHRRTPVRRTAKNGLAIRPRRPGLAGHPPIGGRRRLAERLCLACRVRRGGRPPGWPTGRAPGHRARVVVGLAHPFAAHLDARHLRPPRPSGPDPPEGGGGWSLSTSCRETENAAS